MVAPPCRMKPGLQLYWMVVPTKSLGSDRDLVECSTWPGSEQYMTEKKEYIRKTDLKVAQKHTCNPTPTPKPSWWLGLKDCDVNEVEQFENETQNKWPKWRRRSLYFLSKFHKYLWFFFLFLVYKWELWPDGGAKKRVGHQTHWPTSEDHEYIV